jgi:hypothetical protein
MNHLTPIGANDHVRGTETAAITVVQSGDSACPHTRAALPVVEAILAGNPAEVRFVFRHFPRHHLRLFEGRRHDGTYDGATLRAKLADARAASR